MPDRNSPEIPREPPLETDLYDILGVSQDAKPEAIKSAYKKLALKHHPDKAPADSKDEANHKFQQIAFAYAILSDERRRKRFDLTGSTAEAVNEDEDFNWMDFYREQFSASVDVNALEKLKKEYQGSEEEKRDMLAAFEKSKGDMDKVYESVMLCNVLDDDERFRAIIDKAIADGEVENYEDYSEEPESKRQQRIEAAQKEAAEAEELSKEIEEKKEAKGKRGGGRKKKAKDNALDDNALVAMIKQRQANRAESFFDKLEEKYAPKGQKKRAAQMDEPPEEAFAATGARKSSGGSKKKKTRA
ncbi:DnaJ domain protein [Aspergillus ruber CBS 135680]|uniref:DnaJ-domain-containing protein n=1 Tax=Aspergillus ruber (strain CBS 135680) TaxID=1388766 RepID=A0A017SMC1_ASPRC|nr:DnaJ-domain-containing protein [Aspergillus ruber CBS 135680]EYE97789.1 DnaJ-domain-containing protein [Aspergillus ruber CBS 135680]